MLLVPSLLLSTLLSSSLWSPPPPGPMQAPATDPAPAWARQVLFKVEPGVDAAAVSALLEELGVDGEARPAFVRPSAPATAAGAGAGAGGGRRAPVDRVGVARIHVLELDPAAVAEPAADPRAGIAQRLAAHPDVAWAEPNQGGQGLTGGPLVPDDPSFSTQWPLQQPNDIDMDLPEAWGLQGGFEVAPITVAVIDTGLLTGASYPDLAGLLWAHPGEIPGNGTDDDANGFVDDVTGYDFVRDDGTPDDENGHGLAVTSIMSARADNGADLAGVAPGVRVMALKAFDDTGGFPASGPYAGHLSVAAALIYAADEGAVLANNSWGVFTGFSQVVADAVEYALDAGVHLVFAAGNFDENTFFPSEMEGLIAVAALGSDGVKSDWGGGSGSNFGPWVDVSAGGTLVPAYWIFPGIWLFNGTSMAAPNASGVALMALSHSPGLSQEDLRSLLMQGAVSVDALNPAHAGQLGAGHVNAHDTLELLAPTADLGSGLSGDSTPQLNVWGGTQVADVVTLSVSAGPPSASGALFIGFSPLGAPFKGGTLVPAPDLIVPVLLDGGGAWRIDVPLTVAIPTGVPIYLQALLADAGAPKGFAFTTGKSFTGM